MVIHGRHDLNMDTKGRIGLPSKYREGLRQACDGNMVITMGVRQCLQIDTKPNFEKKSRELRRKSSLSTPVDILLRRYVGNAQEVNLDRAGRLLIPQSLRSAVGLEKHVVLSGIVDKFELWDAGTLAKAELEDVQKIAEGILRDEDLKGISL